MQKTPSTTLPAIDLTGASIPQINQYLAKLPAFKIAAEEAKVRIQAEVAAKLGRAAEDAGLSLDSIKRILASKGKAPKSAETPAMAQTNGNGHKAHTPKVAKAPKVTSKGKVAVKYRDPKHPENTWTGRGMKARWLSDYLKAGAKLEDFRIGA
jgi:DNA-binding protein H-NS